MNNVNPGNTLVRNGLYRKVSDAEFITCGDAALVSSFTADDSAQARACGLADMTPLARGGFRGDLAAGHLTGMNFPVPEKPNVAATAENGELVLRLSQREFWVLGSLQDMGSSVAGLMNTPATETGCYPLFCQDSHAWLMLSGSQCAAVMAKLCGVDMRAESFPAGNIAQTSVARISAIITRHEVNGIDVFSLLFDSGYHAYMWDVLLDAIQEFGGTAIGCNALL